MYVCVCMCKRSRRRRGMVTYHYIVLGDAAGPRHTHTHVARECHESRHTLYYILSAAAAASVFFYAHLTYPWRTSKLALCANLLPI